MSSDSLSAAKVALIRERVVTGCIGVLMGGEDLSFARVAAAAHVPERTIYRYFPTREALLVSVVEWFNQRIDVQGIRPTRQAGVQDLVRRAFVSFDESAPVVRALLRSPEGLHARLSTNEDRKRSMLTLVANEVDGLNRTQARRLAAVVQLLSSATAWQALHDFWAMDGPEAAQAVSDAIRLLLAGARACAQTKPSPPRRRRLTSTRH